MNIEGLFIFINYNILCRELWQIFAAWAVSLEKNHKLLSGIWKCKSLKSRQRGPASLGEDPVTVASTTVYCFRQG